MFAKPFHRNVSARIVLTALLMPNPLAQTAFGQNDRIVATVNDEQIAADQMQLDFFLKLNEDVNVRRDEQALLNSLIDRELIRQFLKRRKIVSDQELVDREFQRIQMLIEKRGGQISEILSELALSEESVKSLLELEVAWRTYITQTLTESRIMRFWTTNREKFDGTEIEASQIFLKISKDDSEEQVNRVRAKLEDLRSQIASGKMTFADAARLHSESPSGKQGGNLGTFEYYGRVAEQIAEAAFATSIGEMSQPVRSQFGWHLVFVNARHPGDLSLEDARPQVVKALSKVLWGGTGRERKENRKDSHHQVRQTRPVLHPDVREFSSDRSPRCS